ncbi:MAG: FctA domain-containing protein, partial [Bacillota bacterium]|nr:FctA domain-containing protein [Bacillota bacterium]
MKNRRTGKFLLALIMSVAMIFTMGISTSVFAADGSGSDDIDPEVSKTLTPNGDGTYTLSLSVTGKTKEVTTKTKANVLIIMDTSGSMDFAAQDETGSKGSDGNGRSTFQLYKKVGNSYVEITDSEKYTGTVYRRNNNKYSEYTGTRFSSSQKRINVARTATNDLIDSLAKNNATVNDTVEICFMTFDSTANSETDWYKGTVMSDLKNKVVQKSPGGGTNWDDALHEARRVAAAKNDGDPTYIIFVSDGNPTYYYDNNHNERKGTGQEDEENVKKSAAPAYAEADLIKAAGYKFYGVGAFGSVDRMQTLCEKANGTYQNYYYAATDQTALEQAFAAIVNSISDSAGSKDVTITDNVTELTSTNQNLTELDTDSFTYTRSDNKAYTGPKATYDGSKVTWNLGDGYMLEDGVTYTVSFRVWPSQAAYDLVAALNNGTQSYDSLDPDVKSQIKKDGNSYSLYSNTKNTASDVNNKVDYTKVEVKESKNEPAGTKNADGTITGTDGFTYEKKNNVWIGTKESRASQALTNPDPMPLTGTKMTVKKEWVGAPASGSVFFELMQDDEGTGKIVELKSGNEWSAEVNIAPGLIVGDETLEPGHNYTLEEVVPEGETADYHYEFDSETHHPMLKKVGNNMAIVDLNDDVKDNVLVGTNTRKSTLDISKTVTGIQNSSKTFTYKVKIKDNNGDDIWFSIAKGDSIVKEDGRISGDNASQVTAEENAQGKTGYYSVPSNTEFNISIKDGENIRFINLPVDSTYSVEEIGMPADGYSFDKVDLNKVATDDNAVKSGAKVTGIIKSANSAYELDYTNKYSVTPVTENLHATKKVEGNDATEAFTFSIEATGDNAGNVEIPSATATTGTTPLKDGDQKTVDFNNIKFKAPGTYTFKVKETNTNVPGGWTYDNQNAKTITVKVEDKSGQLTVTEVSDTPVFTNSYDAEDTTATIEANKKLTGLDLEENLFKFQLYDSNNHEIGAPVGNAANGKVTFPEISYDAVGTYKYKIKEVVPEVVDADNKILAGMTYDISTVNVTVEVTDNEGKLEADVSYADNDNTFENYYASGSAFIQGLKVVDNGAVALEGGEFEFTISSTNGGRLPDETTVANKAGGIIEFGDIEFTLADLKAAVDEPTNDDNNNENNNTVEGTEDTEGEATLNAEPEGTEVEQPAAAAGKTYHYVITESKKVDGVINDGPQEFDIKITDDGE